jgi:hypothetical protein
LIGGCVQWWAFAASFRTSTAGRAEGSLWAGEKPGAIVSHQRGNPCGTPGFVVRGCWATGSSTAMAASQMKGPSMIIDAHGHASGEYVTLEKILEKLNANRIEKVVLFPGEIGNDKVDHIPDSKNKNILYSSNIIGEFLGRFMRLQPQIHFGNRYVYYLRQLQPDKIIQFYWLTPQYIDSLEVDFSTMNFSWFYRNLWLRKK